MLYFAEQVLNGVAVGVVYALIAVGFAMVYGVLRLLNFAHSEVFAIGVAAAIPGSQWVSGVVSASAGVSGWSGFVLVLLGSAVMAGIAAMLLERVAYRPLRGEPKVTVLLTAIAVSLLLQSLGLNLLGPETRSAPPFNLGVSPKIVALVLLVVTFTILWGFLYRTGVGMRLRAVAEDPSMAELLGIRPDLMVTLVFLVGGIMAGVAGAEWTILYGTFQPQMGFLPGLKAFIIAATGSVGSLSGTLIMALGLGLVESLVVAYFPSAWSGYRDSASFVVLFVVLYLRPNGLFGSTSLPKV